MLRVFVISLVVAFTATHLAAADNPPAIRIGISSIGVGGRPFIGGNVIGLVHAQGLLEQEFAPDGIKVEWTFNKGAGPAVTEELVNGLIDLATQGDLPLVVHRSSQVKTKLLIATLNSSHTYLAVKPESAFQSLNDLVGHRMALFKGTAGQLLTARLLALKGLKEQDFLTITLDVSASLPALLSGDVDCMWGGTNLLELEDAGKVRIVFSTREMPPVPKRPCSTGAIFADAGFEQRYPTIIQRFVNVYVRTAAWASDPAHVDEVIALWSKSGTSEAVYRRDIGGESLAPRLSPLFDEGFLVNLHAGAQAALDARLIRAPVDFDGWIEPRYLEHALAEFGLTGRWHSRAVNQQPTATSHP